MQTVGTHLKAPFYTTVWLLCTDKTKFHIDAFHNLVYILLTTSMLMTKAITEHINSKIALVYA